MDGRWKLGYRPALDGVRGLAVLVVMACHFGVPGFNGGGRVGVTTFFVLSGFLITALLLEEHERGGIDLRAFYLRRARRLLPALYVLLALVGLIAIGTGSLDTVAPRVVAVFFYAANWAKDTWGSLGNMTHTWTLAVEEQFYLVWPVVVIGVTALAGRRGLALVAVVTVGLTVMLRALGVTVFDLALAVDALMIGCLLAIIATTGRLQWSHRALGYAGLAVLAGLTTMSLAEPLVGWSLLVSALAAAALIWSAVTSRNVLASALGWRPLAFVGKISYGLYLWHYVVGNMLGGGLADLGLHWLPTVGALTILSFAAALASWRYVEQPFLRRRHEALAPARTIRPENDRPEGIRYPAPHRPAFGDMAPLPG